MDTPPPRGVKREFIFIVWEYSCSYGKLKILLRLNIFLDRGFLRKFEVRKKVYLFSELLCRA